MQQKFLLVVFMVISTAHVLAMEEGKLFKQEENTYLESSSQCLLSKLYNKEATQAELKEIESLITKKEGTLHAARLIGLYSSPSQVQSY